MYVIHFTTWIMTHVREESKLMPQIKDNAVFDKKVKYKVGGSISCWNENWRDPMFFWTNTEQYVEFQSGLICPTVAPGKIFKKKNIICQGNYSKREKLLEHITVFRFQRSAGS